MNSKITYTQSINFEIEVDVDGAVFTFTIDGVVDQPAAKAKLLQQLSDITAVVVAN